MKIIIWILFTFSRLRIYLGFEFEHSKQNMDKELTVETIFRNTTNKKLNIIHFNDVYSIEENERELVKPYFNTEQ